MHLRSLRPLLLLFILLLAGCARGYTTTFDTEDDWIVEERPDVSGRIDNGRYLLNVRDAARPATYWAAGGQSFANAVFEVEATQLSGALNSGYGLLIRVDEDTRSFYALEVSGDGFIWAGLCRESCSAEAAPLLGSWWFPSALVNQGLNNTNRLRIDANDSTLIFYVNGIEVGRALDDRLSGGDVALMVETLGAGGAAVAFDNLTVTPRSR